MERKLPSYFHSQYKAPTKEVEATPVRSQLDLEIEELEKKKRKLQLERDIAKLEQNISEVKSGKFIDVTPEEEEDDELFLQSE